MLNNIIKRFYSDKDDQRNNIKYDNEIKSKNFSHEVIIPFDIYTSKFQDDINLFMTTSKFRSIYMNKIDKNIDLINKMLYEENKDITYISRWMRIPVKVFIKAMNRYNFWVKNRRNEQIIKINNHINRLQNIKGLIQVYIELNWGKWVNTKGILDFIKPWNL